MPCRVFVPAGHWVARRALTPSDRPARSTRRWQCQPGTPIGGLRRPFQLRGAAMTIDRRTLLTATLALGGTSMLPVRAQAAGLSPVRPPEGAPSFSEGQGQGLKG